MMQGHNVTSTLLGGFIDVKGIVSWDFDGVFMILSYSLDVRACSASHSFFNFMFSYLIFISWLKSLSRLTKTT
jgi:hypothetical protein